MEGPAKTNEVLDSGSTIRPQFGTRHLLDKNRVFEHNAWDDVQWTDELEAAAKEKVEANSITLVTKSEIEKHDVDAYTYWDSFYRTHQDRFFKDRHWLFTEFPDLGLICNFENSDSYKRDAGTKKCTTGDTSNTCILEVGCGVGNTLIPLLEASLNPGVFLYGCDFSEVAVNILREHSSYNSSKCNVFVCDITNENWTTPFSEESLDIIILIFVLSALNPVNFQSVVNRLVHYLKPGGMILFRDYGRFDLAQLRFKKGSCLGENFYLRGDGTRSYFFTQDEVHTMFSCAGLEKEMLIVDRRLQVNRGKMLTMYRIWVQAKYRKPFLK